MKQITAHNITSTCGDCSHTANIDLFTSTPINGDLPDGHFQCPNCMKAKELIVC